MRHQYGRHGPHAWVRWRNRRYGRPSMLPVPVEPQSRLVHGPVPLNTERIIFIVLQSAQDPNEENRQLSASPFSLSPLSDTSEMKSIGKANSPHAQMQRYAARQARRDVSRIQSEYDSHQLIFLQRDTLRKRNSILAKNFIWGTIYQDDESPSAQEETELINGYLEEYERVFRKSMEDYQLESLNDLHFTNIRQIAMQDSIDFPANRRDAHKFHQRDLGIIRVLIELEIDLSEAIDHLQEIHALADEYDTYYSNPRKGVRWPDDLEPFPQLTL